MIARSEQHMNFNEHDAQCRIEKGDNESVLKYLEKRYELENVVKKTDICQHTYVRSKETFLVCSICGQCKEGSLAYEPLWNQKVPTKYEYKRITYFKECLAQKQAHQNVNIDIAKEAVLEEMYKYNVDKKDLTPERVRYFLSKRGLSKYYEHMYLIHNVITDKKVVQISPEIETELCRMFYEIQQPFQKNKPLHRKNFLSYSYTIHKLLELLDEHEMAKQFKLLKSIEKLRKQDDLWKKICDDLGYIFIPSI